MKRKFFAMILAIAMTVSGIPSDAWAREADNVDVSAEAFDEAKDVGGDSVTIVESGACGENATYTLDSEGTLVISGSGDMWDYNSFDEFSPFKNRPIQKLVIENGITHIGNAAFYDCNELTSVIIPEDVISIGRLAFYGCSSLTSVKIPEGVARIEDEVFYGCSGLTDIIIPESVTSIEMFAFKGCNSLTNITVPKSVTNISKGAFSNCEKLLAIDVEEDNTNYCSIDGVLFDKSGERILQYPGGKTGTYRIPENVTTIGECAFDGSIGLTGITIPKGLIQIESLEPMPIGVGSGVFSDCSRLPAIDVAEDNPNFCSVDGVLFDKAKEQLLSYPGAGTGAYEIPEGVKNIWYDAFKGCSGLTGITIPEGVLCIESFAFSGCIGLTSITLPAGAQIGPDVFSGCSNLASIVIPKGITYIQPEAFSDCKGLKNITIPDGVTAIGNDAFLGCNNLINIMLPESLTSIDYGAFADCSSLTSITLPESLTYIGIQAFDGCGKLTIYCQKDSYAHMYAMQEGIPYRFGQPSHENPQTYTISFDANGGIGLSQNIRGVTEGAALGELPSVTRPGYTLTGWYTAKTGGTAVTKDTVITSNMTVYAQWKANQNLASEKQSLANAMITLSQTSYSYDGSEKKPAVKSVKLGNITLKSGTDYTVEYQNNKNIGTAAVAITGKGNYIGTATKTFTIRAKTGTTITSGAYKYKITGSAEAAFAGLKSKTAKKVIIPKTVNIGGKNFKVTSINTKALQNTKVTSVTIGANVKTIGASAFAGCSKLSKVTISNSVTKIGGNAFKNCTVLKSVTIPTKVTAIGTGAFGGCKKLATIVVKSTKLKTFGKNALKGIKSIAKIKVPSKKFTAYQKLLKNKGQGTNVKIVK